MRRLLFVIFLITVSCAKNIEERKDILKIAVPIEATGLYPYQANDPHSSRVYSQIFDTLLTRDSNDNIVSSLAEDWKFISPTVLELTIRSNIQFHNGELLTMEDIQYSFEQILSSPNLAHTVAPILRTEISGDLNFRVFLKEPYSALLPLLSLPAFVIVNKKAVLESSNNVAHQPIGTGPYKLSQWNRGQNIILEKFHEYWGEPAHIQKIDFLTVNDHSARVIALESGNVNMAFEIEGIDRERIKSNPNIIFCEKETPRVEYIAMNIGKGSNPLWKNKKGRQAFAYAINQQGIIDSVLFSSGKPANSLLPPMIEGYDAGIPYRQQNLIKAQALIQEMNIEDPSITIWVREGISQKIAEIIQDNFREIGVRVSIEVVEYARFLEGIARGDHDVFILNWTTVTGDADYGLNNLLNSYSWGSKGNRSFYVNQEIDNLLSKARQELNMNSRIQYYKKIQEIVYEDVPYIPLYYPLLSVGMSKHIKGFVFNMFMNHDLNLVYFDE